MSDRLQRIGIETGRHRIEGSLQLPVDGFRSRLKDFLNAHSADFIALTDVTVSPLAGSEPAVTHEFLAVSARHIVLVLELTAPEDD